MNSKPEKKRNKESFGISSPLEVAREQQTYFRSSLLKNNVDLWTWGTKRFPWCKTFCFDIRQSDQGIIIMQLEWLITISHAGMSWILARVTTYDLERVFHNYNKVSCDVECWVLCEATAPSAMYVMWAFAFTLNSMVVRNITKPGQNNRYSKRKIT